MSTEFPQPRNVSRIPTVNEYERALDITSEEHIPQGAIHRLELDLVASGELMYAAMQAIETLPFEDEGEIQAYRGKFTDAKQGFKEHDLNIPKAWQPLLGRHETERKSLLSIKKQDDIIAVAIKEDSTTMWTDYRFPEKVEYSSAAQFLIDTKNQRVLWAGSENDEFSMEMYSYKAKELIKRAIDNKTGSDPI